MPKKLDKETQDVLHTQEKVSRLTDHEGWDFVRSAFKKRMALLLNLSDIQNPNPETIVQIIGSRQLAASMLGEILSEVEGTSEQFKNNSKLTEEINDNYILRVRGREYDL